MIIISIKVALLKFNKRDHTCIYTHTFSVSVNNKSYYGCLTAYLDFFGHKMCAGDLVGGDASLVGNEVAHCKQKTVVLINKQDGLNNGASLTSYKVLYGFLHA